MSCKSNAKYKCNEARHGKSRTATSAACKKHKHGSCLMMDCKCICHPPLS